MVDDTPEVRHLVGEILSEHYRVVYAVDDLQAWAERGAVTSTSDPRGAVLPAKRQEPTQPAHAGRYAR